MDPRKIALFLGCLFSGCSFPSSLQDSFLSQEIPLSKQRQKIAFLQKKLHLAEKDRRRAAEEVERLEGELYAMELHLIQRQISQFEQLLVQAREDPRQRIRFPVDRADLFLKEREMLQQMMENGPSPAAMEAQLVLDRILRIITDATDRS